MTDATGGRIGRIQQCRTTPNPILTSLTNLTKASTTQSPSPKSEILPPLSPYLLEHVKLQDHINLKARGLTA